MTLNFKDSRVNTGTNKYYALTSEAKIVALTVNKLATITHINNQELQFPRTLGTDTLNTFSKGIEWGSIIVRADQDTTVFEVYAS